ncbi:MAG: Fic family protein [Vampirovibrionales bacterium]
MTSLPWVWMHPDWPHFQYDTTLLWEREQQFLLQAGTCMGVIHHLNPEEQQAMKIDLISLEALKTSEIEGELLNRESLQSSIQKSFGLKATQGKTQPREQGIAKMMHELHQTYASPLSHETLFRWHTALMSGESRLRRVGAYREDVEPMQIVSGYLGKEKVHYEAPSSSVIAPEMAQFIHWFNETSPAGAKPLPALTRACVAHWYFLILHPFEDGNGRIGRALVEKVLAQHIQAPTLTSLSVMIQNTKKQYYQALAKQNTTLRLEPWLEYFSDLILQAQQYTLGHVQFLLQKAKFWQLHATKLHPRQERVIRTLFRAGYGGFSQGLTVKKYMSIAETSRATATRDLAELLAQGILYRTGETQSTRYWLKEERCYD